MPESRAAAASRGAAGARSDAYKPYLDGLRAIAVGGVVVYHLNRLWLPGGYLGVDLFFVLSGYLITTLLITEQTRTGAINLLGFWSRRVRRLLPALLLLLLALSVEIWLGGDELAAASARGDFLATLFYFANWHFIFSDQSYFTQYVAASPVRHTWSLAIEEQFYIGWPLVVALVVRRGGLRALAAAAVALSLASMVAMWLVFDASSDPSRAYYGTDTRIFEILFGAALAVVLASRWRSRALAVTRPLAIPALFVLVVDMLLLADDSSLYYHGAAAAVAGACVVLIAGLEAGSVLTRLLALKPLVLIGLVSYGVYLWHFPVILFVQSHLGPTTEPLIASTAVVATAVIATCSFVLVERPIRRGAMVFRFALSPRRLMAVAPATSALVAGAILVSTSSAETPAWVSGGGLTRVVQSRAAGPVVAGDSSAGAADPTPPWTVAVVGDSVMVSAMPGFKAEAESRGWNLIGAAFDGCPVGYAPLYDVHGKPSPLNCSGVRAAHDAVVAAKPDLVIWHDLQSVLSRRSASGALLVAGSAAWTDDLVAEWEAVLKRFTDVGADVVIILPPYRSQDTAGCSNSSLPDRCAEIQQEDKIIRAATSVFWSRVSGTPGVHLLDVDPLLCPSGNPCPKLIDGVEVRLSGWDQTHFTTAGAAWFAPQLLDMAMAAVNHQRVNPGGSAPG